MVRFSHMFNSVSAQTACAAFSCPENAITLILDAGLLLASIIILPVLISTTEFHQITVRRDSSSPAL